MYQRPSDAQRSYVGAVALVLGCVAEQALRGRPSLLQGACLQLVRQAFQVQIAACTVWAAVNGSILSWHARACQLTRYGSSRALATVRPA